ncbi:TatD family hydrolase [Nitrospirillum viridazoti]|uniref:LuxR family transcriptional regulator n=1 Tax=Nitrospirillum viridazoti CBAmc TaxID=1441467 RepID=A0A248JW79_9PROT|nr:TatD family hydrolase [Nitrospirillum amazonense]ASG22776.1 LuxR family transcriptional regulator [Nitrospirillum amazonense CBAmc]TWB33768.1 TatD DNase family protein [Nitrospirillum amazonense]
MPDGLIQKPFLIDSHCHLDFPDFADQRDAVVERARAAGVGAMLTICTHLSRFPQVHAVAQAYPDVWCTVGVHPHQALEEQELCTVETLRELAAYPKVVGLGETGLDYYYNKSPQEVQEASFRAHLTVARETGLPVIIHTRDADEDMIRILREEGGAEGKLRGLLHCFSSSPELGRQALEMGLHISFSGIVTFKKSDELREFAKEVPLDRMLVETDAPFLAPVPMRGKTNEPSFVAHTARLLAEVKGMDPADLARATTATMLTLFDRIPPAECGTLVAGFPA